MTEQTEKKGLSTGAKWGIGCGIGCLGVIVLIAVGVAVGWHVVKGKLDAVESGLKAEGFTEVVQGQQLTVQEPVTRPILYKGQVVKLLGGSSTNVALMCQMAEIHGKIEGKLYFRGQMLVIQPKAEITGGIDAMAQIIQNYGTVKGEITGTYQSLQGNPAEK